MKSFIEAGSCIDGTKVHTSSLVPAIQGSCAASGNKDYPTSPFTVSCRGLKVLPASLSRVLCQKGEAQTTLNKQGLLRWQKVQPASPAMESCRHSGTKVQPTSPERGSCRLTGSKARRAHIRTGSKTSLERGSRLPGTMRSDFGLQLHNYPPEVVHCVRRPAYC